MKLRRPPVILLALIATALILVAPATASAAGTGSYGVSAWTFGARGSLASAHAAGAIDEVQADWYAVRADGSLISSSVDPAFVGLAHADGCRVLAVVTNWAGGDFSPSRADAILRSAAARRRSRGRRPRNAARRTTAA